MVDKLPRTLLDILVQRVPTNLDTGARGLAEKYKSLRADYVDSPNLEEFDFDTELLDDILSYAAR